MSVPRPPSWLIDDVRSQVATLLESGMSLVDAIGCVGAAAACVGAEVAGESFRDVLGGFGSQPPRRRK